MKTTIYIFQISEMKPNNTFPNCQLSVNGQRMLSFENDSFNGFLTDILRKVL